MAHFCKDTLGIGRPHERFGLLMVGAVLIGSPPFQRIDEEQPKNSSTVSHYTSMHHSTASLLFVRNRDKYSSNSWSNKEVVAKGSQDSGEVRIVLGILASMAYISAHRGVQEPPMISTLLILAVSFLAYSNDANDNSKGVATLFGCGVTNYRRALAFAASLGGLV